MQNLPSSVDWKALYNFTYDVAKSCDQGLREAITANKRIHNFYSRINVLLWTSGILIGFSAGHSLKNVVLYNYLTYVLAIWVVFCFVRMVVMTRRDKKLPAADIPDTFPSRITGPEDLIHPGALVLAQGHFGVKQVRTDPLAIGLMKH